MLSSALLIMGLEIGYTKFIFNTMDGIKGNLLSIFGHFDYLSSYIMATIMLYIILLIGSIPGIIYIYVKYGNQLFDTIVNIFTDSYYQELVNSYFNMSDILVILLLILIPTIYLLIRLSLWSFYVIDQGTKAVDALQASWKITNGQEKNILTYTCSIPNQKKLCVLILNLILIFTREHQALVLTKILSFLHSVAATKR